MESFESRYVNHCTRRKMLSNPEGICNLAKSEKSGQRRRNLLVVLDHLKDADFLPLPDMIDAMNSSDVETINILNESSCLLSEDQILALMRSAKKKLHAVSLQDLPFTQHFIRDLFQGGFSCGVLKLNSSNLQKLDMVANFVQLRKLNLDFCTSLTTIQKEFFSQMPKLMHLSMCGTRIANLWTTTAALSKLPSLIELRFQNCLCCEDTGPCPMSSTNKSDFVNKTKHHAQEADQKSLLLKYVSPDTDNQYATEDAYMGSLDIYNGQLQSLSLLDLLSEPAHKNSGLPHMMKTKQPLEQDCSAQDGRQTTHLNGLTQDIEVETQRKKYISHHPSPICFEKHYRDFVIASLPRLEVLDNLHIERMDKKQAEVTYSKYFEYLPYRRQPEECVARILHDRELASSTTPFRRSFKSKHSSFHRRSQYGFSRSLCAAKLGASPRPLLHPISNISCSKNEESRIFRPRQFEYHPSNTSLMAFGTLDGEVAVINHESQKLIYHMPTYGACNSILGLCWLKKYPSKVLGGSDNGLLRLYDIGDTSLKGADSCDANSNFITFDNFEQLTSVHINSTDEQFLVSGCTRDVAMYDMSTGKRVQLFRNLHHEPINVAKFANHSPFMFATSSFDHDVKMWDLRQRMIQPCYSSTSSRGNVMVCFSPDDHYLLVSAVDNEVKQLLAADGRLHTDFGIASSGSSHNYTRSYYMNGRDYIISGSSDEHVVRICCAQTGRRLRDVYFEGRTSKKSVFVQSLRSDPFREFNFSILASYGQSNSKCEIIKVNLLATSEDVEDDSYSQQFCPSFSLGG